MAKTPKVANIWLYNWLRDSGLTQTEVASVCGVTKQAISNIVVLGYMPSARTLHNLCSNYGLDHNEVYRECRNAKEYAKRNREPRGDGTVPGQISIF